MVRDCEKFSSIANRRGGGDTGGTSNAANDPSGSKDPDASSFRIHISHLCIPYRKHLIRKRLDAVSSPTTRDRDIIECAFLRLIGFLKLKMLSM